LRTAAIVYQQAAERWQARAEDAERKLHQVATGRGADAGTSADNPLVSPPGTSP
jgi:hypothetical protein